MVALFGLGFRVSICKDQETQKCSPESCSAIAWTCRVEYHLMCTASPYTTAAKITRRFIRLWTTIRRSALTCPQLTEGTSKVQSGKMQMNWSSFNKLGCTWCHVCCLIQITGYLCGSLQNVEYQSLNPPMVVSHSDVMKNAHCVWARHIEPEIKVQTEDIQHKPSLQS